MNRILPIAWLAGVAITTVAAPMPSRPNIVFILADDLGSSDTTLHGTTSFYRTPNIERLARRGMTFTRAYAASPLCSPTRAAILTGLSPARTGITAPVCHLPEEVLAPSVDRSAPPDVPALPVRSVTRLATSYRTIAVALKEAGYATAHFGKWHLGPEPYSPLQHGFDVDLPHWPGPGPGGGYLAPWKFPNFPARSPGEHIEDRMAAEAVRWMETNRDRPFFLNYWAFSVHAPFEAKPSLIEEFRSRVNPADAQRSPTYAAMVASLDDAVGTLLDAIDRLGLAERTIIVFTSDNGGNMYNKVDGTTPTSNRPLRGGKGNIFDGGTRVPCVIVWPGVASPGSRSDALIQSEDFYPTFLDGLGIAPAPGQRFDGISILPALRGEPLEREAVIQYFPQATRVPDSLPPAAALHHRDGWKLIRVFHGGPNRAHRHLLFDLNQDPGETRDLAGQQPERVRSLAVLLDRALTDAGAVLPTPNPRHNPATRSAPEAKPSPQAGGWQGSADTRLEVRDGELHVTSTGRDPWLARHDLPSDASGPFTLRFRMSSTGSGPGAAYYTTPSEPRFHRDRMIPFDLRHDGQAHDYEVAIPAAQITSFRIDPGNAPGQIRIISVVVLASNGTPAYAWPPSAAPQP